MDTNIAIKTETIEGTNEKINENDLKTDPEESDLETWFDMRTDGKYVLPPCSQYKTLTLLIVPLGELTFSYATCYVSELRKEFNEVVRGDLIISKFTKSSHCTEYYSRKIIDTENNDNRRSAIIDGICKDLADWLDCNPQQVNELSSEDTSYFLRIPILPPTIPSHSITFRNYLSDRETAIKQFIQHIMGLCEKTIINQRFEHKLIGKILTCNLCENDYKCGCNLCVVYKSCDEKFCQYCKKYATEQEILDAMKTQR